MKYVIKFNEFIKESYESNTSINWELIDMAKELALDSLDEGLQLSYYVRTLPERDYREKSRKTEMEDTYRRGFEVAVGLRQESDEFTVLEGKFSHDFDQCFWNEYFDENKPINSILYYSFWVTSEEDRSIMDMANRTNDIVTQLKEIYPIDKINIM